MITFINLIPHVVGGLIVVVVAKGEYVFTRKRPRGPCNGRECDL